MADEKRLQEISCQLLEWCNHPDTIADSEELKTKMVNAAVKLHNKVRNISPTDIFKKVKGLIRSVSAWILSKFGANSPKVLTTCIKLHARAAQELVPYPEYALNAYKSTNEAIIAWEKINIASLEQVSLNVVYIFLRIVNLLLRI